MGDIEDVIILGRIYYLRRSKINVQTPLQVVIPANKLIGTTDSSAQTVLPNVSSIWRVQFAVLVGLTFVFIHEQGSQNLRKCLDFLFFCP